MNTMRMLLFCVLQFLLLSMSCEGPSERLEIKNESDGNVIVYTAIGTTPDIPVYPDTLLPQYIPVNNYYNGLARLVHADNRIEFRYQEGNYLFDSPSTEKICIFIISEDTINKYGWNSVRDNYKILKRYDVTSADLKELNNSLTYPPTPQMSKVYMYPRYKPQ